jgi:hypothetical protein
LNEPIVEDATEIVDDKAGGTQVQNEDESIAFREECDSRVWPYPWLLLFGKFGRAGNQSEQGKSLFSIIKLAKLLKPNM